MMIRPFICLFLCCSPPATAQTLTFPNNAQLKREVTSPLDSYAMPTSIWDKGTMTTAVVEGTFTQQAWRIDAQALTTLQLLQPLRQQLRDDRFRVIFECQTEACGGFDFRFGTQTLPPPEMQINLGDFRFLAASRVVPGGSEYISLFISRTAQAGFVQVTQVVPPQENAEPLTVADAPPLGTKNAQTNRNIASQLRVSGHAVLEDLTFATGSSQLGDGPFDSLQALADYLAEHPEQTVALVGHTDSAGQLDANIALSKRRATSTLERLVDNYGIPRDQLEAQGMGYLAPISTNLTQAGRDANRRVEVIVTSTSDPAE